ncbi:sugar ABC transporter ATP-binding protein [Neogemmobacter tilapiae]|uniref:ABC transporter ATP-binding protein n=1 Tax=Neogemmobacter tilapiae TaxID=875041 RepID=A0A918TTD1_9RHOB|nr:sugar ABC transporter ATP-binding protein [Gemmobacter tilapiae]GHC60249.1 ABC transporter ATP-binding protein [Gemmobacter tilapiae]
MQAKDQPLLEMRGVSKSYGGVRALSEVNFSCHAGSTHGILGENGAGKSTLIKMIAGVLRPDAGEMFYRGQNVQFASAAEASAAGIVCMFQELSLIPDLSVADNICLLRPPRRFGLIDAKAQRQRAEALLARLHCEDLDPRALVRDLSLSRRQMVEIAKALAQEPQLLILDEATSALTRRDVETVYGLLGELRSQGVASLFISHRMAEVDALCDRLSVFRNGQHVESFAKGAKSEAEIVRLMIGRDVTAKFPPKADPVPRPVVMTVQDLSWEGRLKGLSFGLGKGEILGLGGLDGQGQKELLLALFGVLKAVRGRVEINGISGLPTSPYAAKTATTRLALVPEDRKSEGLMLALPIADNLVAAAMDRVARGGIIDRAALAATIAEGIARLQIKAGSPEDAVATLSGGNQQKVVIAKWLMIGPDIILLNDPTRGIDIGTKQEIYRMMRELADQGKSILFYSSDYAELSGCCDRVIVLYDGQVIRTLEGAAITDEALVSAALNIGQGAAA